MTRTSTRVAIALGCVLLCGAGSAPYDVQGEWTFASHCNEKPPSWYAVIGPNYLILPNETCIYDPAEFARLFTEGYVAIPADCYFSQTEIKKRWDMEDPDLVSIWDIEVLDGGKGLRIGDSEPYRRCPKPLNLPGRKG
jgi:hypothetical protein